MSEKLEHLAGWQIEHRAIVKEWELKDFVAAMAFVNRVAALAEAANHHPDIDIRYNHVKLALITHSAGGLTENDFKLATQIEAASA